MLGSECNTAPASTDHPNAQLHQLFPSEVICADQRAWRSRNVKEWNDEHLRWGAFIIKEPLFQTWDVWCNLNFHTQQKAHKIILQHSNSQHWRSIMDKECLIPFIVKGYAHFAIEIVQVQSLCMSLLVFKANSINSFKACWHPHQPHTWHRLVESSCKTCARGVHWKNPRLAQKKS